MRNLSNYKYTNTVGHVNISLHCVQPTYNPIHALQDKVVQVEDHIAADITPECQEKTAP